MSAKQHTDCWMSNSLSLFLVKKADIAALGLSEGLENISQILLHVCLLQKFLNFKDKNSTNRIVSSLSHLSVRLEARSQAKINTLVATHAVI